MINKRFLCLFSEKPSLNYTKFPFCIIGYMLLCCGLTPIFKHNTRKTFFQPLGQFLQGRAVKLKHSAFEIVYLPAPPFENPGGLHRLSPLYAPLTSSLVSSHLLRIVSLTVELCRWRLLLRSPSTARGSQRALLPQTPPPLF